MKRFLYILIILGGFVSTSYGQTFKAYLKAAEEAAQMKNYFAAYTYLQEAYEFDTTRLDLAYGSADMARMYDAYGEAEKWYSKVVDEDYDMNFPKATFYLGEMQQKQGKYEDAIGNYRSYLSEHQGEEEYFTLKAEKEISASEFAIDQLTNPDESVTVTRLGAVNTEFSEVGALERNGSLFYSSLRFLEPNPENVREPKYLAKILVSENGSAGEPDENLNEETRITSHTTFSSKSNKIFYTICDYTTENNIKCDLYYRDVLGENEYGEAVRLPDHINDAVYTSTQPAIGIDAETNKEILYFVSNRPGGKGKFDIWYTIIDDNMQMTQPMNLDSINTIENDATPFFHNPSNTLYFSSQGYQGMGGYDIYRAAKENGAYGEVEHLPNPVNSSYDDIYYTISNDMLSGYFSSNRESSTFIEDAIEACCFDIYHAKYEPVNLSLNALTCEDIGGDQRKLLGATVVLINAKTGEVVDSITNDSDDTHEFELERNQEYLIVAKKDFYQPDTVSLSTKRIYKSKTFTKKICLIGETLDLDIFTFDKNTGKDLIGVEVTVTDLSDGSKQIFNFRNLNGNDFTMQVTHGHNYQVVATRPSYKTEVVDYTALGENLVDGRLRLDVFLELDLLSKPLALYFDNDQPNRKSVSTTTKQDYSQTYDRYYARKNIFLQRAPDEDGINSFFENHLRGNYDSLQVFLEKLEGFLKAGEKLELVVRGFTSPLASSAYNLYLGQRRVASVMNELRSFKDGALVPYIESESLILTDISFGEALAPDDVSDSRSNQKLSVFSPEASKQRRVEIIGVNQIVK